MSRYPDSTRETRGEGPWWCGLLLPDENNPGEFDFPIVCYESRIFKYKRVLNALKAPAKWRLDCMIGPFEFKSLAARIVGIWRRVPDRENGGKMAKIIHTKIPNVRFVDVIASNDKIANSNWTLNGDLKMGLAPSDFSSKGVTAQKKRARKRKRAYDAQSNAKERAVAFGDPFKPSEIQVQVSEVVKRRKLRDRLRKKTR